MLNLLAQALGGVAGAKRPQQRRPQTGSALTARRCWRSSASASTSTSTSTSTDVVPSERGLGER